MSDHAARRDRVRLLVGREGLDALIVTAPANLRWLTGLQASTATLLVPARAAAVLTVDGRYAEQARALPGGPAVHVARGLDWLEDQARGLARIGVEADAVTWDTVRRLEKALGPGRVQPSTGLVADLRQVKDDAELGLIERACRLTSAGFDRLVTWLAPGMTERAVATRLERELVDHGADGPAFPTIVASGPLSARPHHRPTDRRLARGDLVTVDFGAALDGYRADMTRTVALGRVSARRRELHAAVAAAQDAGVAAVRDGVGAGDVDQAARAVLTAAGLGDAFVHGTGHGLGLEIHEPPILAPEATATLRARMTVTVEPGAYLPGLGGVRIEDVVAVTHRGAQRLTTAPRDLLVL